MPRKKKKITEERKSTRTQSMDGWSIGDIAWTVTMGDTKPTQLEITSFHPEDTIAPSVTGTCILTGKSRTVAIGWCEDNRQAARKNFEKRRKVC